MTVPIRRFALQGGVEPPQSAPAGLSTDTPKTLLCNTARKARGAAAWARRPRGAPGRPSHNPTADASLCRPLGWRPPSSPKSRLTASFTLSRRCYASGSLVCGLLTRRRVGWAGGAGLGDGDVDSELASQVHFLVEDRDRFLRLRHAGVSDEAEAPGARRVVPLHHNVGVNNGAERREELFEVIIARAPVEVGDVNLRQGRCGRRGRAARRGGACRWHSSGRASWWHSS